VIALLYPLRLALYFSRAREYTLVPASVKFFTTAGTAHDRAVGANKSAHPSHRGRSRR